MTCSFPDGSLKLIDYFVFQDGERALACFAKSTSWTSISFSGRRKGACLFCQEYFMDLYLLAELKTIALKITTVDMLKPPPDFRSNFEATPPPILIDSGESSIVKPQDLVLI